MKKIVVLMLCVALMFTMSISSFAGCGGDTPQEKYISQLYGVCYFEGTTYKEACDAWDLDSDTKKIVGGGTGDGTDLNDGCGRHSSFIRLVQNRTDDSGDAITNLIALYQDEGYSCYEELYIDGCWYYPVFGYFAGETRRKIWEFNFNHRESGTKANNEVYLFCTEDKRAGKPITNLKILQGESHANDANLIGVYNDSVAADFNKGFGDTRIYIQIERDNQQTASVFSSASVLAIVAGGTVIILGTAGAVVVSKKKKNKEKY